MRIVITFAGSGPAQELSIEGPLLTGAPTADAIAAALPIEARANVWGDEIYFAIPVQAELESGASDLREVGDLAFWPPGNAFCVFFGRTPASQGNEPRAASPVNLVGRLDAVDEDLVQALRAVRAGAKVRIAAPKE